jgi:hypothetical protein
MAPAAASAAGVFTWNLASDFTATGSGSNPDHDQYGATPWSYVEGPSSFLTFSHDPSKFKPLSTFVTSVRGGLAGWTDPTDPATFIGINPTDSTISQPPIAYPPHAIAMQPAADRLVAVGWTSPFAETQTVTVSGAVSTDDTGTCLLAEPQWSLDQNGTQLESGSPLSGSIADTVTVPPGGTIYVTVVPGATAACSVVGLALTIQANGSPPAVTLSSPAQGAVIAGGQPTFSGTTSQDFGDSQQVTVRVYSGSSVTDTPVETLTTTASGGAYQVQPTTPLGDGTYTAQAEQDDVLSPPEEGFSTPVTFTVENGGPQVTLNSLGSSPLTTGTPTLTGTAGTSPSDSTMVAIGIYAGQGLNGTPVRFLTANVNADGTFSAPVTPALADGTYTAVAAQRGPASAGISQPMTFVIKATGPRLVLTTPAAGASVPSPLPFFAGTAGTAQGDSSTITVTVYKGPSVRGKRLGRVTTTADNGKWGVLWPHQLHLGLYTVQASQSDDAGHVTLSTPHRFLIVPGRKVIGSTVSLSRSGTVSLPINCLAAPGITCAGNVLIVTRDRFQPSAGGPSGRLRLLFQYVQLTGGHKVSVHAKLPAKTARILRRAAPLKVLVTIELKANGRIISKLTGDSTLRAR